MRLGALLCHALETIPLQIADVLCPPDNTSSEAGGVALPGGDKGDDPRATRRTERCRQRGGAGEAARAGQEREYQLLELRAVAGAMDLDSSRYCVVGPPAHQMVEGETTRLADDGQLIFL